jgi:DNA-binding MarR family transcriptional regulator
VVALRGGGGGDEAGDRRDRRDRRREAALAFVEALALFLEREGLPRMAGRIFAWLLICDPPLQSAADLTEALRASKGSISTMTALLVRARLVERVALPGRRRDYLRVRPRAMSELMLEATARLAAFRRLAEQGLGLLAGEPPDVRERLEDVLDVSVFLEAEYPALIARFEARRDARAGARREGPAGGRDGRG